MHSNHSALAYTSCQTVCLATDLGGGDPVELIHHDSDWLVVTTYIGRTGCSATGSILGPRSVPVLSILTLTCFELLWSTCSRALEPIINRNLYRVWIVLTPLHVPIVHGTTRSCVGPRCIAVPTQFTLLLGQLRCRACSGTFEPIVNWNLYCVRIVFTPLGGSLSIQRYTPQHSPMRCIRPLGRNSHSLALICAEVHVPESSATRIHRHSRSRDG